MSSFSVEDTKDDLLNSEKNRFELTKSIKPYSDTNLREQNQPQGAATIRKSPNSKLADKTLSENDEENVSLTNHTLTSSISETLSKEINSLSEKLSNREIRPGDRVKSNSKRQLINRQSKRSLHEADWYRQSMETNKDYRNELKQVQLISNKHLSQTKFDQQKANLIENKHNLNLEENQKINRQISKDRKINLLPKKSSSRSLKQSTTSKVSTDKQQYSNKVEDNQMKRKGDKVSSTQQLPTNQRRNSDHYIQEK